MSEVFRVLEPGLLTTVQDLGRWGYQRYGVPPGGGVDPLGLRIANLLVGNREGEAVLECTGVGPTLEVLGDCLVALAGAEMDLEVDGVPLSPYTAHLVRKGQLLRCGVSRWGLRGYVAVAGGIDVPPLLGSRSTCLPAGFGGQQGRPLQGGNILQRGEPSADIEMMRGRTLPPFLRPSLASRQEVRVLLGPQQDYFSREGLETFLHSTYQVTSKGNRMGIRLGGPPITHRKGPDIVSDALPLGGIQVPGDGQPILLLNDRQTTGGYAKVATVITADLWRLGQLRPGDTVRFRAVEAKEAQRYGQEFEQEMEAIRRGITTTPSRRAYGILVEDQTIPVAVEEIGVGTFEVQLEGRTHQVRIAPPVSHPSPEMIAFLAGVITGVHIREGEEVQQGAPLLTLAAMKVEHELRADRVGRITKIHVRVGQEVKVGDPLLRFAEAESPVDISEKDG
jgi:antagonist of KipI